MRYADDYIDTRLFDAAEFQQRLQTTKSAIPVFRDALKTGDKELNLRFQDNASITEIVGQRGWLIDQILIHMWQQYDWPDQNAVALLAVGGYGRQELHPASDVDLLFLYHDVLDDVTQEYIEQFLTFLWDIKLEVGHSVRTPIDTQAMAADDITVMTNLLEARLLIGSQALFEQLQALIGPEHMWPAKTFFEAKVAEQASRYSRYHDTAYNLEPNIKDGPGGLRDIQTVLWVAKRHFGSPQLQNLFGRGFLTNEEYQLLNECQNFLWKVRYLLHQLTGRHDDRLGFEYQRTIAEKLGYQDTEQHLGVETLMKQYYRTAEEVRQLNEMLLQLFQEAILRPEKNQVKPLNKRFRVCNDLIEVAHDRVFADRPFALLEIFLLLENHPEIKGIRASTVRLLRYYKSSIDDAFRSDLRATSLFYEILCQPQGVTRVLRMMRRYGILDAYIPAFGNIVGQMQYDLFHVYTVDQHTLSVLHNLRCFSIDKHQHEFPLCSKIMAHLPKPELLYLAGLFHDIAKGRGGDHSELGQHDAMAFCQLHSMSPHGSRLVAWLVKNHLLMSVTAQRQDISDPDVIHRFALQVMDLAHLDYLYLLTVADIRATSPKLWNSWKASLLEDLYNRTRHALRDGLSNPIDRQVRIESIKRQANSLLDSTDQVGVGMLWDTLDDEYFLRCSPGDIARETDAILLKAPNEPLVLIPDALKGSTDFTIYTEDRDDLFATTALYLEKQRLNVVAAYIITTKKHCTLLHYTVLEDDSTHLDEKRAEVIRQGLIAACQQPQDFSAIKRHQPSQIKYFTIPTQVEFTIDHSSHHTVMELVTTDRPGVLSRVAQVLQKCGGRLKNAKIATFGSKVEDVFYIIDKEGKPLQLPEQLDCLRTQIKEWLDDTEQQKLQKHVI
ncbi:[protein-PII] uridylyltransferase [Candidatus Venteria ishoeyi]|uniref:[protein-PII] uridylyltransferase n=1 Tax=Candidatus Venteria ishoeyi TaxID=1899563 RepID=UPI0025A52B35|nr:[protein-PII] uridylyltransferase [Candidatus Venteria ishoeyi]MDM8545239.1 [protein-PII] uridylyltransferase [Candidatus Venteria ishoeyi]